MEFLLRMMNESRSKDRVTRVLLLWVNNHILDFENDSKMMEFLEDFETLLGTIHKLRIAKLWLFLKQ